MLKEKAKAFENGEGVTTPTPGRKEGTKPKTTPESKWKASPTDLTREEKLMIIGMVVELSIIVINSNHVYTFEDKLYKQKKGGATGLRLTGILARIHMDRWSKKYKTAMEENLVKTYSNSKYVDDINLQTESI